MKPKFIDRAEILVQAGKGGDGCNSFYRDRRSRFPKPDGGDGGKGGDIVISADRNVTTLLDLQYRKRFAAEKGKNGQGNDKKGADGDDSLIRVPVGTIVKDKETGYFLRDLTQAGERVIAARGGKRGLGNSLNRDSTKGQPGEEKKLFLELKLIADVGIIGYPNVGKSTLLNSISRAKSKIGAYPFTTRFPILGCLNINGRDTVFTVADIPGLIEGAHKGKGLGHEFLKHIERTRILIHVVDMSQTEGRNAFSDYLSLNKELFLYNPKLKEKLQIVAANKMDLPKAYDNLEVFSRKFEGKIYPVSAISGEGVNFLSEAMEKHLK